MRHLLDRGLPASNTRAGAGVAGIAEQGERTYLAATRQISNIYRFGRFSPQGAGNGGGANLTGPTRQTRAPAPFARAGYPPPDV